MINIVSNSVSEALSEALYKFASYGQVEGCRSGDVLVLPDPVTTTYTKPQNRVLFADMRDANPFFHLFEALWMLSGSNDVAFLTKFNKRMATYSDDGAVQWGAYGWRWRQFFGYDQLELIVQELSERPDSRRAVLSMWNAAPRIWKFPRSDGVEMLSSDDLSVALAGGKDVPCNTHAYFDLRGGKLNMTVCNRSNDAWWGAYGANMVHFSILLEYMAAWLNVPMGVYRQMSNNLHLYTDVIKGVIGDSIGGLRVLGHRIIADDLYPMIAATPMIDDFERWHMELSAFIQGTDFDFEEPFFQGVALPMLRAHTAYKRKQYDLAIIHAESVTAPDWRAASFGWLRRREAKRREKVS